MAVEHLTRMESKCHGGEVVRTVDFNAGYNRCLKAVLDYFQLAPIHSCTNVSVPHLISYLEHRLSFDPAHHEIGHRTSVIQKRPLASESHQMRPRPQSSCDFHHITAHSSSHVDDRAQDRSTSPEKRRRSDDVQNAIQILNSPSGGIPSPSPNLANLNISDTPPPTLVDLVTSASSSCSSTSTDSDEQRRRSTSFKKVLKERYLKGSRSE